MSYNNIDTIQTYIKNLINNTLISDYYSIVTEENL